MVKKKKPNCETDSVDLGPAKEVKESMGAGQLTAHQPLSFHQAARLPSVHVIDGCHHHHIWEEKQTENLMETASLLFCKHF